MTIAGRDARTGRFTSGNNFGGRTSGAKNLFTLAMEALESSGHNAGSALVAIASDAESYTPELRAKADSKLLEVVAKAASTEQEQEREKMSIEEVHDRIHQLTAQAVADGSSVVINHEEWLQFKKWRDEVYRPVF